MPGLYYTSSSYIILFHFSRWNYYVIYFSLVEKTYEKIGVEKLKKKKQCMGNKFCKFIFINIFYPVSLLGSFASFNYGVEFLWVCYHLPKYNKNNAHLFPLFFLYFLYCSLHQCKNIINYIINRVNIFEGSHHQPWNDILWRVPFSQPYVNPFFPVKM